VIYFQLFSILPKQSAILGCILLFLTDWFLFEKQDPMDSNKMETLVETENHEMG